MPDFYEIIIALLLYLPMARFARDRFPTELRSSDTINLGFAQTPFIFSLEQVSLRGCYRRTCYLDYFRSLRCGSSVSRGRYVFRRVFHCILTFIKVNKICFFKTQQFAHYPKTFHTFAIALANPKRGLYPQLNQM